MKDTGRIERGGRLLPEYYAAWAAYVAVSYTHLAPKKGIGKQTVNKAAQKRGGIRYPDKGCDKGSERM